MFRANKLYKNQYLQFKYFDATNEFEQFCLEYLDYIRSIDIPDICCDEDYVEDENKSPVTSNSIITSKIKQTIHVLEKKGEYTPNILKEIS